VVHELSKVDARRIMVRAQWLGEPRPDDVLDVIRQLTLVQHDPIAAVAPSADLVLWSRIGSAYRRAELADLLDEQALIDHQGLIRPAEDMALYRAEMAAWPGVGPLKEWQENTRDWVAANDGCRREILDLLRSDGPLPTSAFPDSCEVPWRSSGWNRDKNVQMLLLLMVEQGEVATAGRDGTGIRGQKLWDLAERIYPDDPVPDVEEALARRNARRLAALGLARAKSTKMPTEPNDVGPAGDEAVVEGVKGLTELVEFDYQLEMYKPAAQRKWGYYALPILYGDRLVGKLDARTERDEGVLLVNAVHEDEPFTRKVAAAVDAEIDHLAEWLGVEALRN